VNHPRILLLRRKERTKAEFCALLGLSSRWGSCRSDNLRWEVNGSERDLVHRVARERSGRSLVAMLTGAPSRLRMKSFLRLLTWIKVDA
jgi:hypothetical protein